ncbi:hypothetical protein D8674_005447 [Pyrus ussuriensis x Pyrus communis]|uniref:Uncharacterized protein n=1 Tax=Pyrus ussuriensis x Pyrus communis TaxID=2448454 RepID=A0A5N5FWH4_9ROSA|nr:hypothetical protein D8674_005447 [Pyrus ussuriensis x Pyrus communis]
MATRTQLEFDGIDIAVIVLLGINLVKIPGWQRVPLLQLSKGHVEQHLWPNLPNKNLSAELFDSTVDQEVYYQKIITTYKKMKFA